MRYRLLRGKWLINIRRKRLYGNLQNKLYEKVEMNVKHKKVFVIAFIGKKQRMEPVKVYHTGK